MEVEVDLFCNCGHLGSRHRFSTGHRLGCNDCDCEHFQAKITVTPHPLIENSLPKADFTIIEEGKKLVDVQGFPTGSGQDHPSNPADRTGL